MNEKAEPRPEGDPCEDEVECVLNGVEEDESDEVDEPGNEQRGV